MKIDKIIYNLIYGLADEELVGDIPFVRKEIKKAIFKEIEKLEFEGEVTLFDIDNLLKEPKK